MGVNEMNQAPREVTDEEEDDPNWINLGGGYGRKTPEQWNLPSGQVWSDPNIMGQYRAFANDPNTSDAQRRVYRTLAGMPAVEPTPQRTGGRIPVIIKDRLGEPHRGGLIC